MAQLSEEVDVPTLLLRFETLEEEFRAAAMLKYEDEGWALLTGGREMEDTGPDLESLRDMVAPQLRLLASANPLIKKGKLLRQSYVWSATPDIPAPAPGRNGRPSTLTKFVNDPVNLANLLDSTAHEKMESAVLTDGCYLLLGNTRTKQVRPIPLQQIRSIHVDSEFPDTIVAYKRQWDVYDPETKKNVPQEQWYYVESVDKRDRADFINEIPVNKDHEMLDFWVNRQVGWALGTPDALAAAPWAQMYVELMQNGRTMTDALARFAARVTSKDKKVSSSIGAKVAKRGSGQIASMAQGSELEIFASAGKTYDFNGIRPVAAMVATALEVSIVHLLSDPGAAGSSYGSAANLDRPTKNAIKQRQDAWVVFLKRVLRWATNQDVNVKFPPLEDETYRKTQTAVLANQTGLLHPDESRRAVADAAGIMLTHESIPEGYLMPNNEESLPRKDIDTEGSGVQAASPDQGRSNGSGGAGSTAANDQRTDGIAETLKDIDREELREYLRELLSE